MPVNLTIQADIVDIRSDQPRATDAFLVDTNVWYWMTYSRASQGKQPPLRHQTTHYPPYLRQALSTKADLLYCGLSMAELAHQIEKCEREIYEVSANQGAISTKEYRHNYPGERQKVVAEIQSAWAQVKVLARPLGAVIDEATIDGALVQLPALSVDGYDLLLIKAAAIAGISQIITDDSDYATVPGIQIYTANQNAILSAHSQGKLVRR